ncbi:MAG TPA: hypothetical protein VGH28_13865 [Polyangiaceae bacterium]|jgi:hypothetical protein
MTVGYLIAQDLVDAISEPTYMAIFDDTNSGDRATVDASSGVVGLMRRAHARCVALLPRIYTAFPPESPAGIPTGGDQIPILLKDLEVQLLTMYACERHPELMKTYGIAGPAEASWRAFAKDIAEAALMVAPSDNPPQQQPANVGGVVHSGSSTDPTKTGTRYFADGTSDF